MHMMKIFQFLLLAIVLMLGATLSPWGEAVQIGVLDETILEASGLAISARYPNRLYHINDSGDIGRFLITDEKGTLIQSVRIAAFDPIDVEDLTLGPCQRSGECLFLADIGDNARVRPEIEIVIVEERENFPDTVPALARVRVRYPDRPHDAESLAIHPNGDLFLLTKELERHDNSPAAGISHLYKLAAEKWRNPSGVATLEPVADIDFEKLTPGAPYNSRLPTAMDISPDGKRVLILTYMDALELAIDFSKKLPRQEDWRDGIDYQRVRLTNLEQQEAIAYLPDGREFIYTTERPRSPSSSARMMRVSLLR